MSRSPASAVPVALGPVAVARNGVIGRGGALPWRLASDLAIFKAITRGKPLIMGRRTWDSLPRKPLPGRLNVVLSRDAGFEPVGAVVCDAWREALAIAREQAAEDGAAEVCVIGGAAVFTLALPRASRIYITEVDAEVEGDVVMAPIDETGWREVRRDPHPAGPADDHAFVFRVLERA